MLYIAIVLNPRSKLKFLTYCFKSFFGPKTAKYMADSVEQALRRLFHEYKSVVRNTWSSTSSMSTSMVSEINNVDVDMESVGQNFNYNIRQAFRRVQKTSCVKQLEIDVYLLEELLEEEDMDDRRFDILQWWKKNGH